MRDAREGQLPVLDRIVMGIVDSDQFQMSAAGARKTTTAPRASRTTAQRCGELREAGMFITKKHLSRRTVLKGVGVTSRLPLLDAMIPAGDRARQTAAAPKPRMGFVYFPHGAVMASWQPTQTGTDFEFPPILKPLEPFKEHLTVVSGLRNKAGESPSPHAIIAGTWLSCVHPAVSQAPHGGVTRSDRRQAHRPGHGAAVARGRRRGRRWRVRPQLRLQLRGTIAFRTPTQPLPMEHNPRKVFHRLFGQGDTARSARDHRRDRSMLDHGHGQTPRICSAQLGAARPRDGRRLSRLGARDRAPRAEAEGEGQLRRQAAGRAARHAGGLRQAARHDVRA